MSDFDSATQLKIDALKLIPEPQVCESVAIYWGGDTGTKYYANSAVDVEFGFPFVVDVRLTASAFLDVTHEGGLSDDTIDLQFWDADAAISDLYLTHGAGVRVEVFYYFPQVNLLLSQFFGHLQTPSEVSEERFITTAAVGFRSSNSSLPRRALNYAECQAVFGGLLKSLPEIARNDCPYNQHLEGGTVGNLDANGQPFRSCPLTKAACVARLGDDKSHLSAGAVIDTKTYRSQGRTVTSTTKGNESTLKDPCRVIIGERRIRELPLLAFRTEDNRKHPDKGTAICLHAISEGEIDAAWDGYVDNKFLPAGYLNVRTGALRQSSTAFSANVFNYSGTAVAHSTIFGDYKGADASRFEMELRVRGLKKIRIYTSETEFYEVYSTNRQWAIAEALRNPRWGHGLDIARFEVEKDLISNAVWGNQTVGYQDAAGNHYYGTRSTCNAELNGRSTQEQIEDLCLAGRLSTPFPHAGKLRIVKLAKETIDDSVPLFTDRFDTDAAPNIIREDGVRSSLTFSQIPDGELTNSLVVLFDDAAHDWIQRPLTFPDVEAQLRAGESFGDRSRRVIEKKIPLLGVTNLGEAARLGNLILDLGKFDEGGLKNNLEVTFTTWYAFCLGLHKYKVIRVVSRKLERFGFEYFRIKSMTRHADLKVEIVAQAYPVDYYERLEQSELPPPRPAQGVEFNPGGSPRARPYPIGFDEINPRGDRIDFQLSV